eukprot:3280511-Amphidinium_carterae.1
MARTMPAAGPVQLTMPGAGSNQDHPDPHPCQPPAEGQPGESALRDCGGKHRLGDATSVSFCLTGPSFEPHSLQASRPTATA